METWGELFWDAWIRFRLWCRSLVRTCWPPRIEAWQVCTVTGVAAIVLTLLSLRNPGGKAALAVDQKSGATDSKQSVGTDVSSRKPKKLASTPAVDPYDQAPESDIALPVEEEIALDQSEANTAMTTSDADSEFVESVPTRSLQKDLRSAARTGKPSTLTDTPIGDSPFVDDTNVDETNMVAEVPNTGSVLPESEDDAEVPPVAQRKLAQKQNVTQEESQPEFQAPVEEVPDPQSEDPAPRRKATAKPVEEDLELAPEIPSVVTKPGDSEELVPTQRRTNEDIGLDTETHPTESRIPDSADTIATTPVLSAGKIERDPDHYKRPHHEHEDAEHERSEMPVARAKKLEFVVPPAPTKALVRSGGHYKRFGEDEEESGNEQESTEIRPKQVEPSIAPRSSEELESGGPEAKSEGTAEPVLPNLPAESKVTKEEFEDRDVPAVPKKRVLPPVQVEVDDDSKVTLEVVPLTETDLDAGPRPPVMFAPEPDEPLVDATLAPEKAFPEPKKESHGPVLSTEAADHEAHIDEDVVVRGKRKQPIKMKHPAARTSDPEIAEKPEGELPIAKKEFHGPVLSTEAADHEAHLEEDELGLGKRKTRNVAELPPVSQAVPQHPAETEVAPVPPKVKGKPMATDVEAEVAPKEYHGPVLSTDSVDHEAHIDEDVLVKEKRKKPLSIDLPIAKRVEFHGPVLSTDPTNHEAHIDEDGYSRGNSSTNRGPVPKTLKRSPEHQTQQPVSTDEGDKNTHEKAIPGTELQPAGTNSTRVILEEDEGVVRPEVAPPVETKEPIKPVVTDETELIETPAATTPRTKPAPPPETTSRTAPRVIRHDEDATDVPPAVTRTFVPDEPVAPPVPELTQPRGPSRISIPGRVQQPEENPIPSPRSRRPEPARETVPPAIRTATAAKLVMEITGPRKVPVGTQIVMHFKVKNVGTAPATGIMVSDVLPPGMQHRLSPDLEYTIPRLGPGESRETNLTVHCVSPGVITNRAVLSADGDLTTEASIQIEAIGNSLNSSANPIPARSPVTISHRGPEKWLVDSTGQFLVTVTNTSGQRLKDVTIVETYPADTNLIHATVGNKVDAANRTVCWTISDFAPGAAYILETELHSTKSGRQTTVVQVKIDGANVAEDRWTAVSYLDRITP